MMKRVLAFVALWMVVGCGRSVPTIQTSVSNSESAQVYNGTYPIQAITTVGMVADVVRNVGGDRVEVTQIMGSGVDPHLYKSTSDDVRTILAGDIVFYAGLMLEGKMADTLIKVSRSKPVYAITEEIDESILLEPDDFEGHFDPHVWMDVDAWSNCVDAVAKALSAFDSKNADKYESNATAYREQLKQLHEYGQKSIATIPESSRVLITSHDAFNYFGRAYGLDVQGVQGISTESESGLQRINKLVDTLVEKDIRAVFVESSVPRKNIEALVDGARSRQQDVTIGGELFSDAMGEDGTYEGTYIGMLDHNITTVTRALGGEAPKLGMNGKLTGSHE